jgi:FkbM family methyltransferase
MNSEQLKNRMAERITTAEADSCRRPTLIESVGASLGHSLQKTPLRRWLKSVYHRVLELQTGGKGLECKLPEGEVVRVLPAFRHLSWNMDEYKAFRSAMRPGGVALDVGANAGCYSLLLGQWARPSGKVFAFEPAPETFAGLSRHIELNHLGDIVTAVQAAVSDRCATASFLAHEHQGMNRLVGQEEAQDAAQVVQVPTVTIDEFCAREKILPDFIKVDVEGFELAVLRGARETIKACGERLALFVEMHPTTWREIGLTVEELMAELEHQRLRAVPLRAMADMWAVEGVCLRIQAR